MLLHLRKDVKHSYTTLSKYLSVIIDEHLTWNEHVKTITSKANKVKGFLQCNIKYCPSIVKARCYTL